MKKLKDIEFKKSIYFVVHHDFVAELSAQT